MTFYDQFPIDDYVDLNRSAGENHKNLTSECPWDSLVPNLDIRCGPILKLMGTFEDGRENYRATLLLVITNEHEQPKITYEIGPSCEVKKPTIASGEFPGHQFYTQDQFVFLRYNVDLLLTESEQKVKYYINGTNHSSYQFFIPGRQESMNVVSFSCNGISVNADNSKYTSSLWLDVLRKHANPKQHYHVMLGGGDQIYSDAVKFVSKQVMAWTEETDPKKKAQHKKSPTLMEELNNFYLLHYMKWFGKGFMVGTKCSTHHPLFPFALATIPSVNIYDDHDIIDGFGSYRDETMNGDMFIAIGNVAYKFYMIFQHHTSPDEELHESDPSWILGEKPGPFIKQKNHSNYVRLGREIALLGLDCRTERSIHKVVSRETYNAVFKRLEEEISANPEIKHLLVMLGIPIFYPRLAWLEWIFTSKLFKPVRKLERKGIIVQKGLVNEFDGDVDVLDDLNDHWCSRDHKPERNQLLLDLINFGARTGVRITVLSGDVHLACISRIKTKYHSLPSAHLIRNRDRAIDESNLVVTDTPEYDSRLIFNVISSAIVNLPPPNGMVNLLNQRNKIHHFDSHTDEDVVPIFLQEPTGEPRANHRFLNHRNWCDLIMAKQSKYLPQLAQDDDDDKVLRKFPTPTNYDRPLDKEPDEVWCKYPLRRDSLVTTLHIEQDGNNYESATTDYEVLVPPLLGQWKLDMGRIKHIDYK